MTTPAEFKAVKELRQIDDQGISGDLLMLLESDSESLKVLLSQLANYITKPLEDELIPPGAPQYWPGDVPPNGFAFINNGLTFNTVIYPKLAIAWPTGVIPPHKGLVIECTADGSVTGETQAGEVKSHSHKASLSSVSLNGNFSTNTTGEHQHGTASGDIGSGYVQGRDNADNFSGSKTGPAGDHSHNVNVNFGSHDHSVTIDNFGQSRNTVDRINYNIMVRLA